MPRRAAMDYALLAALFLLAAWRLAFVLGGVDLDTDAYGHHSIARELARNPGDLRAHWVWLPLFHYLQALFVPLGATLTWVRVLNVGVSVLVPWLLYVILRDPETHSEPDQKRRDAVAFLAAILTALSPISMQMGTTGQTEPLDALGVLVVIFALQRRRFVLAAVVLGLGVMLRYEMWAVFLTTVLLVGIDLVRPGLAFGPKRGSRRAMILPVLLPALVIFAWAWVRAPVDGGWFKFLGWTQKFVHEALGIKGPLDRSAAAIWKDLTYYPYEMALQCFGFSLVIVPFGFIRTLRREGLSLMGPLSAVLAFITYAWLQRGSLGLARHFVAVVPHNATGAAHGAMVIAEHIEARVPHVGKPFALAGFVSLSVAGVGLTFEQLTLWMDDWSEKQRSIFGDRHAVAAYLRTLPPTATIFCDEPTIEVFSGLSHKRFRRPWLGDDANAVARVQAVAQAEGEVYVTTWSAKLTKMRAAGELVFRPPGSPPKFEEGGLAVIRLRR